LEWARLLPFPCWPAFHLGGGHIAGLTARRACHGSFPGKRYDPPHWFAATDFNGEENMTRLLSAVRRFLVGKEGATMVEYGLMLALIAVVCLVAVTQVGTGSSGMYNSVSASL
jgi:pilus assembly protein Flp/PilA